MQESRIDWSLTFSRPSHFLRFLDPSLVLRKQLLLLPLRMYALYLKERPLPRAGLMRGKKSFAEVATTPSCQEKTSCTKPEKSVIGCGM